MCGCECGYVYALGCNTCMHNICVSRVQNGFICIPKYACVYGHVYAMCVCMDTVLCVYGYVYSCVGGEE